MKIFVRFQPSPIYDNFEGARLRKTIKSALEALNIPYTINLMDDFDVAHFIYIEDESVIQELKERKIPIVVSALYCEYDPSASYIEYKEKDAGRTYTIKAKAVKFLDSADLVLVPNEAAKKILIDAGVATKIEICPPGVNFARFDFSRDDEKELFYRYFSCEIGKKIVLAIGDCYDDIDGLSAINKAAKICPDVNFYCLLKNEHGNKIPLKVKRQLKKSPKNVKYTTLLPDDIYRSGLLNAEVYVHTGYKPAGIISIVEAMAAKCQLVVREQSLLEELAIDQKTAYVASFSETLASIIKDHFEDMLKPTTQEAYKMVSKYGIKTLGQNLKHFYQQLIKK